MVWTRMVLAFVARKIVHPQCSCVSRQTRSVLKNISHNAHSKDLIAKAVGEHSHNTLINNRGITCLTKYSNNVKHLLLLDERRRCGGSTPGGGAGSRASHAPSRTRRFSRDLNVNVCTFVSAHSASQDLMSQSLARVPSHVRAQRDSNEHELTRLTLECGAHSKSGLKQERLCSFRLLVGVLIFSWTHVSGLLQSGGEDITNLQRGPPS
ncbi:hypothetical protein CERSUDRAFT_118384 [Gelatoporia subvermispora B]|uniref:Uncharacterized protein n=1 Tax=Ceriporiopsis subvermispora (strain B) TaxID=914234 RepID=M2QLF5_CERS8|nr:hypothetical protein CERSUDRAFT_118384 [Gelatoporia subvermispora B]